jgi:hypothetical protein
MSWTDIEVESARLAIEVGLPIRSRWLIRDTPQDWDFSNARYGLRRITRDDLTWRDIDKKWDDLLVFGSYDFCEGGGALPWIAVRTTD